MHTNETYNQLKIDEAIVKQWPFSPEIKAVASSVKWDEINWTAFGLPAFDSEFSIVGGQLYLDQPSVQQQDFTGEVLIKGVVAPENHDSVYVCVFKLDFLAGRLAQSRLEEQDTHSRQEYDEGFAQFKARYKQSMARHQTWWFRNLYAPYFLLTRQVAIFVVDILRDSADKVESIIHFITPEI